MRDRAPRSTLAVAGVGAVACLALAIRAPAQDRGGAPAPGPDQVRLGVAPDASGGYVSSHVIIKLRPGMEPAVRDDGWTLRARPGHALAASARRQCRTFAADLRQWQADGISAMCTLLPADRELVELRGMDRYYLVHVPEGTDAPAFAEKLAALDAVLEHAEVDGLGGVAETIPDDPFFSLQYGLHNTGQNVSGQPGVEGADINATLAWDLTTGSAGMTLAVIDAGFDEHDELAGRVESGWAFDGGSPGDTCFSHGTHVAGIAAATGNNGTGIAGVDWNVHVQSFRVLNGCSGGESTLASGILEAVARDVDVINMSLQYYSGTTALQDAVETAYAAGIPMLAASGNNQSVVAFPARWPETIAVAATNNVDEAASFSNPGPQVDIAAPGDDIYSLTGTTTYGYKEGTSMATPAVSGLVCLMLAIDPTLTAEDIRQILCDTAVDVDVPGVDDETGCGRIDAFAALEVVQEGVDDPGVPGDVNGDGLVTVLDLLSVMIAWGPCGSPCPEDLDGNGVVDVPDLLEVLFNWS